MILGAYFWHHNIFSMHHIAENIKEIRKQKGWTQGDMAKQLGVKRSLIGAYEEGRADPRISFLQLICDTFHLNLDGLINHPLGAQEKKPKIDFSGRSLRVLPIVVDRESKNETATLVPVKAAAGYLNGYGDVDFIEQLPTFQLPFPELPRGRTYRLFQIEGDSMLPVKEGSYVICGYVMDWKSIKNDQCYVIVSKSEGIVFKRVLNNIDLGHLTLKSDNTLFDTYSIDMEEVIEVWKAEGVTNIGLPEPDLFSSSKDVAIELVSLREKLIEIERKLKV